MLALAGSGLDSLAATVASGALWQPVIDATPVSVPIPIARIRAYLFLDLGSIAVMALFLFRD
jgi:hypothetical protein